MTDRADTLYLLAAVRDAGYDPARDDNWVAADEAAHTVAGKAVLGAVGGVLERGYAQRIGAKLAALERRGLVESKHEGWGKLWRLAPRVRGLFDSSGAAK